MVELNGEPTLQRQCVLLSLNRSSYEDIYLKEYQNVSEVKAGIANYISFYNTKRYCQYHASLQYQTPEQVYNADLASMSQQGVKVA